MNALAAGVADSLALTRPMGPFFYLLPEADGPPWRPMAELADGSPVLAQRIAAMRRQLQGRSGSQVEDKIAASVVQLALSARLMSPALASAAVGGWVPDLSLERLRWQPTPSNPVPVALPDPVGRRCPSTDEVAEAIHELVIEPAMRPLVDATMAAISVSPQVLWGNVASSMAGAAVMIQAVHPELAERARRQITAVLAESPLDGGGGFGPDGQFRRGTCCLLYRLPRGQLCNDCVLAFDH